jgi:hypothetical protein
MAIRYFSREEVRETLKKRKGLNEKQKEFAARVGVSAPFLANVVSGERLPNGTVLDFLGFEDAGQLYKSKGKVKR